MNDQGKDKKDADSRNFWDMDTVLPRQIPRSAGEVRDTETTEVEFDAPKGEIAYTEFSGNHLRIPDGALRQNLQSQNLEAARRAVEESFADAKRPYQAKIMTGSELAEQQGTTRSFHTPGDVKPIMSVPVISYEPENSMLKSVEVFRWPSRYNYYEHFIADAERYFTRAADECPFVDFFTYMPQYMNLSQEQLHWYLYWRDNVRHGVFLATDYSYIFLYIYEILNLPEKIKPQDGLRALCDIWLAYREKFPRLDRYLGEWVCDYCLVNALPAPLERLSGILPSLIDKLSFKEFYIRFEHGAECPFTSSVCDVLSNYSWRTSKYAVPDNRQMFEEHLYGAVLGTLRRCWEEYPDFTEKLGMAEVQQTRNAYSGAVCTYPIKRRIDVKYLSLSRSYQLRYYITELYKLAENGIRAHLGIKSRLTATGVPEPLRSYVHEYFDRHLPSQAELNRVRREAERAASKAEKERERAETARKAETEDVYSRYYEPVSKVLSTEEARKLEERSWANTELLVPEEEREEEETPAAGEEVQPVAESAVQPDVPVTESDNPYENFVNALSPFQYEALKHIVCGEEKEYRALCASKMLLPETVAEEINNLAVTYTDDTALDAEDSFWHLSDYYANEINDAVIAREDS